MADTKQPTPQASSQQLTQANIELIKQFMSQDKKDIQQAQEDIENIKKEHEKIQATQKNIRQKMYLPFVFRSAVIALIIIVVVAIVPGIISTITYSRPAITTSLTPTPNPTETVEQIHALASRADQQLQQSNSLLNIVTSSATVMGVVFALFAIIAIALGAIGFFTNNGFRELEDKVRENAEEIEKKRQKIQEVEGEIEKKRRAVQTLESNISTSRDRIVNRVTQFESELEKMSNALTWLILGYHFQDQKQTEKALDAFERAQKLREKDPLINYTLGKAYSGNTKYEKAIYHLDIATQNDSQYAPSHMELGLAYRRQGDEYYNAADLEKEQKKKKDWHSKANDCYRQAIEQFEQAIKLDHKYEDAHATLGGLYRRWGEHENNEGYYQLALDAYVEASKDDASSSYALGNVASLKWYLAKNEKDPDQTRKEALEIFTRTKEVAQMRIDKKLSQPPYIHWDYYDWALALLALEEVENGKEKYIDMYEKAIHETIRAVDFDGVLSNLYLLDKATERFKGLNEVIQMIEKARQEKLAVSH